MSNEKESLKITKIANELRDLGVASRAQLIKKLNIKKKDLKILDTYLVWVSIYNKKEGYEQGRASMANDFKKLLNIKENEI